MRAEDLQGLPADDLRHELLIGHLLSEPPPGYRHGWLVIRIGSLLRAHVVARGQGEVVGADSGFLLSRSPDTVRAPDVAFVSSQRLESFTHRDSYFPGAPDLAVEVLSSSERAGTIHGKVADYLAAGARMVWVVDPQARTVSVYRSLLSPRLVSGEQPLEGEDVLPGFSITVSEVFWE